MFRQRVNNMRKVLIATATLLIGNIAWFYGMKEYTDTRQVRLVSATLPSVVKIMPIGPIYRMVPEMTSEIEITFHPVRVGFGRMGHGSGVFISKDGLIVTCAHVVEGTSLAELSLDGDVKKLPLKGYKTKGKLLAYVVGRSTETDVALLRVINPKQTFRAAEIGKSVRKGLSVLTIGFPGPFSKYVTAGVVSGSREGDIYSDLVIAPGNSGGGVFDSDGRIIGLARFMTGPFPIPTYQGFSGLTALKAIREIVEKYRGF
jgi:S1-C subfamily serine protease